jgi:hypothetical protein
LCFLGLLLKQESVHLVEVKEPIVEEGSRLAAGLGRAWQQGCLALAFARARAAVAIRLLHLSLCIIVVVVVAGAVKVVWFLVGLFALGFFTLGLVLGFFTLVFGLGLVLVFGLGLVLVFSLFVFGLFVLAIGQRWVAAGFVTV